MSEEDYHVQKLLPLVRSAAIYGSDLPLEPSGFAETVKFDYYASERWLPSDDVIDISDGPENSVLILTGKGLAKICFIEMTLYDKAMFL